MWVKREHNALADNCRSLSHMREDLFMGKRCQPWMSVRPACVMSS